VAATTRRCGRNRRPQHVDAADLAALAPFGVVEDADHEIGRSPATAVRLQEQLGAVVGADEQHLHLVGARGAEREIELALAHRAIEQAWPREQREQHEPADEYRRTRHDLEPRPQKHRRHEQQQGEGGAARNDRKIVDRDVAPHAARNAREAERDGRSGREQGRAAREKIERVVEHLVADAQIERNEEGRCRHAQIVGRGEHHAVEARQQGAARAHRVW
jgi:hypothetical protein